MSGLCLKNITKTFKSGKEEKTVLSNINLDIKDKSFTILLGPSGCGKSTLLRLIAGLETPDCGEIFIDNKIMNNVLPKDRNIAFVFQSYALYPHMTVFDNIAFPLKIRGYDKKTIKEKVLNASKILGLEELLKRKPKELSGGQRQRVALGRAIVREAKVFLMDEPLSNLDAKLRANMRVEIRKLHCQLNTTFIYVTHDQTEALTMGDEIVILNEGVICQKDTPENVFKNPKNTFVASFSGTYPMNLLEVDINNGKIDLADDSIELPKNVLETTLEKNKVIVGIRPENIKLQKEENDFSLTCDVDFIENTGAIKVLHLKKENMELKAVVNSFDIKKGKDKFYISKENIMYFDPNTKARI